MATTQQRRFNGFLLLSYVLIAVMGAFFAWAAQALLGERIGVFAICAVVAVTASVSSVLARRRAKR